MWGENGGRRAYCSWRAKKACMPLGELMEVVERRKAMAMLRPPVSAEKRSMRVSVGASLVGERDRGVRTRTRRIGGVG